MKRIDRRSDASLTVEAAATLPILLYALTAPLFWMIFFQTQQQQRIQRCEELRNLSQYAYVAESVDLSANQIILTDSAKLIFLAGNSMMERSFTEKGMIHPYVGEHFDNAVKDKNEEEKTDLVYLAESGRVFHRRQDCSYLKLKIREIDSGQLKDARNQNGAKYYACEICTGQEEVAAGSILYITAEGNRYHRILSCHSLVRKIKTCTEEAALEQGRRECSRCSGRTE